MSEKKTYLSLAACAFLLDRTSERRVQQLAKEGWIPRATRGQYELVGAVHGMIQYLKDRIRRAEAGAPDYSAERARWVKAKADLAVISVETARGNLIDANDFAQTLEALYGLVSQRLLAMPDSIAARVFEQQSVRDTRNVLHESIRELLTDLAETEINVQFKTDAIDDRSVTDISEAGDGGSAGAGGVAPATGPDGEPVGRRKAKAKSRK